MLEILENSMWEILGYEKTTVTVSKVDEWEELEGFTKWNQSEFVSKANGNRSRSENREAYD